jgi:hypothetical protein
MRRAIWLLATAVALVAAAPAAAGCFATVGLAPLPNGVGAGEIWAAELQVLQHGRTPMADARPVVLIEHAATGAQRSFPAALVDPAGGRYRAEVVFPAAGSWSVAVDDGFPVPECAQTSTFGTFSIAAAAPPPAEPPVSSAAPAADVGTAAAAGGEEAAGGSVALPLGLGLGLGLLAAAGVMAGLRARHARLARSS